MNAPDVSRLRIRRDDEWLEPRRRGRVVTVIVVALVIAGAAFAWWKVAAGVRPLEITVATVLPPDVGGGGGSVLTASGYIVARRKAGVGPKVAGLLEWLGPEEGDRVREGEVIGRLQNHDVVANLEASRSSLEETRANLVEAQANLAQYRKEFDRARALLAEGVISGADYDVAEWRLAAQEARVRSQQAAVVTAEAVVRASAVAVEDTSIRAPFTGTVLTKDAEEGETVAPAAAGRPSSRGSIVTMADLATLEAEVDVNESYIARLRQGQPARIVADSFPEKVYRGEIRQVIPTADRQKATVQVKVGIVDPGDLLRPDMGAKVTSSSPPRRPRRRRIPFPGSRSAPWRPAPTGSGASTWSRGRRSTRCASRWRARRRGWPRFARVSPGANGSWSSRRPASRREGRSVSGSEAAGAGAG